jgi:hypothetical protein
LARHRRKRDELKGEKMIPIIKRYLITGSWHDKQTNSPKAMAVAIKEGNNKQGNRYQFLIESDTLQIDARHSIGEILAFDLQPKTAPPPKA